MNYQLKPFTVICVSPKRGNWMKFDIAALNHDDAHQMCQKMNKDLDVIWVNSGYNNTSMEEREIDDSF